MTTSNKNFKVKNGLEVLGTFATVDGNEILTSASVLDALANVDTTGITDGQTIIYDEATLTFVPGTATGGGASVVVSDTAPLDPELNTLWYHSNSGALFIRLGDVDSEQWVQIGMTGPQGIQGESGILAQATAPIDTTVLWLDTDEPGIGIPLGGTAGQALVKADSANFNTEWADVYTQTETDTLLSGKSDTSHTHDSRYYTETETDTLLSGKSDTSHTHDDRYYTESETNTQISNAIAALVDTAPSTLDTLNELSNALADDPNFATTMTTALAGKSDTSHTHDDRYYTETEVSTLLETLLPPGTINQTARATAPTGWLLCQGQTVSRTTYSKLFEAIGTSYGAGDGSTTFALPNMQGKVPVGKDSGTFSNLGATGGAETVTLDTTQIPSHTHTGTTGGHSADHNHGFSGTTSTNGAHQHWVYAYKDKDDLNFTGNSNRLQGSDAVTPYDQLTSSEGNHTHTFSGTTGGTSGNHTHDFTSNSTGGGQAHTNLQPYVVVNYMIKI